ncbi:MAG: CDP-diacylglycerol--glycerol-3-phosphate 3-phosphatidyltransferase [Angelakisella sp.]|nr:CDP-diacylglycerol--glycerol-3-phosphate 3-phosphatidyltransferase [Angelakisella sp.]MCI9667812.1 CDP-diacylglycerol--glycerol-3-phosphate 3-phosphatidyltransferase [Angelakisella sp.]
MNLPNKLTTLRIVMIPLFLLALYQDWWLGALLLFALASLTDALDGHIARSQGLVTDFGKFMDPLADKLLVTSALLAFVELLNVPGWVVFLIIGRELAITGLRTIAAGKGIVMAADKWGKLKTVSQMVWICYGLVMGFCFHSLSIHGDTAWGMFFAFQAGMVVVLCTTLFSGWNYLWNNRGLFSQMK